MLLCEVLAGEVTMGRLGICVWLGMAGVFTLGEDSFTECSVLEFSDKGMLYARGG